jgi:hypothetical protein
VRLVVFASVISRPDSAKLSLNATILTAAEPGVYFIAACLPALRSLFKPMFQNPKLRFFRSIFSRQSSTRSASGLTDNGIPLSVFTRTVGNSNENKPSFKTSADLFQKPRFGDGNDHRALVTRYQAADAVDTEGARSYPTDLEFGRHN